MQNVHSLFRGRDVRSCTNSEIVETFLYSLRGLSVWKQLASQDISNIELENRSTLALLWPRIKEGNTGRSIILSIYKPSSWPFSIGHEFCHTFFQSGPDGSGWYGRLYIFDLQREEDICNLFAWRWLIERGNFSSVMKIIKEHWNYLLWPKRPPREDAQLSLPML